jgi:hypothetical protein
MMVLIGYNSDPQGEGDAIIYLDPLAPHSTEGLMLPFSEYASPENSDDEYDFYDIQVSGSPPP